jgi:hypothetical protein
MVTGESMPVEKAPGSEVIGATVVATMSPPAGADEPEVEGVEFEPQAAKSTANNGTSAPTVLFTPSF